MLFNSQIFIFLFLPAVLIGWYTCNHFKLYKTAMTFLTVMSLVFYAYYNVSYLFIILGSMIGNFLISYLMKRFDTSKWVPKLLFFIGLTFNIGLLGYYKYVDFTIANINFLFGTDFALKYIVLPLGISFFTLQQISFIIDRYWKTAPHYGILEYFGFVSFFPQLIAGPIVLHNEIIPQFNDLTKRKFDVAYFSDGIILFSVGLIKKVLLADSLALIVNYGFEKIYWIDTPSAWFVALCYAIELYFDFSGYCDMASGIAKMFNFDLPANFKSPYKSHNMTEYWRRWHYTLTRFLTTYIFTPLTLTGVRKGKAKLFSYLVPMVVFLISGFWHGASWTFVIWGILHGIGIIWSERKFWKLKKSWFTWASTFTFVVITAAIFRSETLDNMIRILKAMFIPSFAGFIRELSGAIMELPELYVVGTFLKMRDMNYYYIFAMVFMALFYILLIFILKGKNSNEILKAQKAKGYTTKFTILLGFLTVWAIVSLTQVSTFLYFNF